MDTLLDELTALLGPAGVVTDPADVAAYCTDWRGAHRGTARAVLRPASTAEVAAAVRCCHAAGVAVVPQGGNTGLSGGAVPDVSGHQVVLSLGRLRAVRAVDPVGDTITVEAGVVLADVQAAAERAGRLFPLSLGSEGSCTVGGNLATNAGGTAVLRYGMMRALVLGLEVVLPDGRVWDGLRALRKDNTGYDLTQLFVGSEGTLGVITAATLRLFPATPRRATAWVALPSVAAAVDLLGVLRTHAGESLTAYELVSREALDVVLRHLPGTRDPFAERHGWYGLVELAGPATADLDAPLEAALGEGVEQGPVLDAVVAGSPAQRAALWLLREGISEAQNPDGASLKHDVSVPVALLPDLLEDTARRLDAVLPGVRLVTYGHVGDGNVHHNLAAPRDGADDELLARAPALADAIHDAVAQRGGSISAEHGLGTAKRDAAARRKDPVELDLMRAVKQALDPAGLMNPGKVLPLSPDAR
jgi:FAD/FMN-containing dehydrogenase